MIVSYRRLNKFGFTEDMTVKASLRMNLFKDGVDVHSATLRTIAAMLNSNWFYVIANYFIQDKIVVD